MNNRIHALRASIVMNQRAAFHFILRTAFPSSPGFIRSTFLIWLTSLPVITIRLPWIWEGSTKNWYIWFLTPLLVSFRLYDALQPVLHLDNRMYALRTFYCHESARCISFHPAHCVSFFARLHSKHIFNMVDIASRYHNPIALDLGRLHKKLIHLIPDAPFGFFSSVRRASTCVAFKQ